MSPETTPKELTIELITASSCKACVTLRERLKTVIEELDPAQINYREIDVLEELDYAVELGVLSTPAIAINGNLVFASAPSLKRLQNELRQRLQRQDSTSKVDN